MRLILTTLALAWLSAQAGAAACTGAAQRVNGFDYAGPCVGSSENAFVSTNIASFNYVTAPVGVFGANIEGQNFVSAMLPAGGVNTIRRVTITAASYPTIGTDWSAAGFLVFHYASTSNTASSYVGDFVLPDVSPFHWQGQNLTYTAAIAGGGDWNAVVLSLNYVRNLGVSLSSINSVVLQFRAPAGSPGALVGLDDVALLPGSTSNPSNPLGAAELTETASCMAHNVTLTPLAPTGTDPVAGYHIYRSTSGAGGPFVSYRYVVSPATTFTENGPIFYDNVYYKVLPYSISSTAFSGYGQYNKAPSTAFDPALPGSYGVHEAALSAATALGPFNNASACPPTPTPTATVTPTVSATTTASPTATPSFTVTLTSTVTMTATPSSTATPSPTITDTFTTGPTNTPVPPTNTFTPVPPTNTFTPGPTSTITQTFTITPTPTNTPKGPDAQLYPNPFNPDKELFYLGNVQAGAQMTIYNLIGEKVYNVKLQGNPNLDFWDGLNNNGVKVVTGIYFVVIDGNVHRLAVVRN